MFFRGVKNFFIPSSNNAYRPGILGPSSLVFFFAVVLAAEGFLIANLLSREQIKDFLANVIASEIIFLTNEERTTLAQRELVENKILALAAQAKAKDMATRGYFSHATPEGAPPWQWIEEAGYAYQYAGENLAVRFIDSSDVVSAWMTSPGHKDNIVKSEYTEIGVGVAQGMYEGGSATFVVQFFAAPRAQAAITSVSVQGAQSSLAEVPGVPQVAGESIGVPQTPSQFESLSRQFLRALAEPRSVSFWVLWSVIVVLLVALVLAILIHIQIQPTGMILSGIFVVLTALGFIGFNSYLLYIPNSSQTAGVYAGLIAEGGVIIDAQSAQTQKYLLPP